MPATNLPALRSKHFRFIAQIIAVISPLFHWAFSPPVATISLAFPFFLLDLYPDVTPSSATAIADHHADCLWLLLEVSTVPADHLTVPIDHLTVPEARFRMSAVGWHQGVGTSALFVGSPRENNLLWFSKIFICLYLRVCVYLCIYWCMYVCICVYTYVFLYSSPSYFLRQVSH